MNEYNPPGMHGMDVVIQRAVGPAERRLQPLYYRLRGDPAVLGHEPEYPDRCAVRIPGGMALSSDTYFNAMFEHYWRAHTTVGTLRLRMRLNGAGTVRLLRRSAAQGVVVLAAEAFDGAEEVAFDVPPPALTFREAGALSFEVVAGPGPVVLRGAEWVAVGVEPAAVGLVAAYCTFDREEYLLSNVRALRADPAANAALERILIVDQGSRKVRAHAAFAELLAAAGDGVRVVEQGNYGGAGGFTRAILEARATPGATHILLMDDDAVVEPESVFRAAAFLALARADLAVGAPMLDLLRPREIHEAGGRIDPLRFRTVPRLRRHAVASAESLAALRETVATHYNGWWFFAFPLPLIGLVGLPLPLFLRGDDAEYGYRLSRAGVPTVTLPGLGVWHEPLDRRTDGWQQYYDFRNVLVLVAIRAPQPRWRLAAALLLHLGHRLLVLDYRRAELLCAAAGDYCRGPAVLGIHPAAVHRRVVALASGHRDKTAARDPPLPSVAEPANRTRAGRALRLLRCVLRQACRTVDTPPAVAIAEADAGWHSQGKCDVAAVEGGDPESSSARGRSTRSTSTIWRASPSRSSGSRSGPCRTRGSS